VRVGPGREAASDMGPVVTRASRDRIVSLITSGEEAGAKVVVDGRDLVVPGHENGFFVGPTLVDQVAPGMDVYKEEIFGPVLSVLRAATVEEAIDLINANPYGNGTAIFTSHGGAVRQFVRGVKVGMIGVNVPVPVPMAYHSFGGWKNSLFGEHHVHGSDGVRFYTRAKVVTQRWPELERDASFDMPTAR
jgi:malonate-semialdehyde dehydrogenase (acetylating)/methylmalonate-semialdehyde dehydrogenase